MARRPRAVGARFSAINNTVERSPADRVAGSAPVGAHDSLYSSSAAAPRRPTDPAPSSAQLPPERGHEINFSPCTSSYEGSSRWPHGPRRVYRCLLLYTCSRAHISFDENFSCRMFSLSFIRDRIYISTCTPGAENVLMTNLEKSGRSKNASFEEADSITFQFCKI